MKNQLFIPIVKRQAFIDCCRLVNDGNIPEKYHYGSGSSPTPPLADCSLRPFTLRRPRHCSPELINTSRTTASAARRRLNVAVVPEPQVVPDGVGEVGGEDVRLEDVDVDADADGLPSADGAHGGHGGPAVLKSSARQQLRRVLVHLERLSRMCAHI